MTIAEDAQIGLAFGVQATAKQMLSPRWRLGNLYTIQSKSASGDDAGPIPFRPTPEQWEVIDDIYLFGWEFLLILKSRQLGMSTVICLIILDTMLFGKGVNCNFIDKKEPDAQKKLDKKIKYAFKALPQLARERYKIEDDNDGEFTIRARIDDESKQCTCNAGVTARGDTSHILCVSEWGEVQKKDKARSKEILTGSIPTADHPGCLVIIETTWKGGRVGELWAFVEAARKIPEHKKNPKDPRILFFGWWTNPDNKDDGDPGQITPETHDYCDQAERIIALDPHQFAKLRRIGGSLSSAQRLWYQKKKEKMGLFMLSEHPTTIEECFESPEEGAFFDAEGLAYQESVAVGMTGQWKPMEIVLRGPLGRESAITRTPDPSERDKAPFLMLEEPREGESYILPSDWGVGRQARGGAATGKLDSNASCVIRAGRMNPETRRMRPPQIVCCIAPNNKLKTAAHIQLIKAMHMLYGRCCCVPETNNKDNVTDEMEAAGISNIWDFQQGASGAMPGVGKTKIIKGWYTTEGSRRQMLSHLHDRVREHDFIVGLSHVVQQLKAFVTDEFGRSEAAAGSFDDWVLMLAIGMFCISAATPYVSRPLEAAGAEGGMYDDWQIESDACGI